MNNKYTQFEAVMLRQVMVLKNLLENITIMNFYNRRTLQVITQQYNYIARMFNVYIESEHQHLDIDQRTLIVQVQNAAVALIQLNAIRDEHLKGYNCDIERCTFLLKSIQYRVINNSMIANRLPNFYNLIAKNFIHMEQVIEYDKKKLGYNENGMIYNQTNSPAQQEPNQDQNNQALLEKYDVAELFAALKDGMDKINELKSDFQKLMAEQEEQKGKAL